jgi:hypothetical protein
LARRKAVQGLANVEVGNARDFKDLITAGAIATDKVALLEGRLPGQAPLALALLVNGDIGIDNRTVNISEKELEQLAEARLTRTASRPPASVTIELTSFSNKAHKLLQYVFWYIENH